MRLTDEGRAELSAALTAELRERVASYEVWRHDVSDPDPDCADWQLTGRTPVGVSTTARGAAMRGFGFVHMFTARGERLGAVELESAVERGDTLCLERDQITLELS